MSEFKQSAYGSQHWASQTDVRRAGMYKKQAGSVFLGFHKGRKLFGHGQGGILTVASPRSGKLTTQIIGNVCGKDAYQGSIVICDPKGEVAAVSQNQMFSGKPCYYFNPMELHGLPKSKINLLDHIVSGSPSIVVDAEAFMDEWEPLTGSSNGKFFELSARDIAVSVIVTWAEVHGSVDLPTVYKMINQFERATPEWLNLEYDMLISKHDFVRRVANAIMKYRNNPPPSGGGMAGVISELYNVFTCLKDPILLESLSPPFDFSFATMYAAGARPSNFYIMPPNELIPVWSKVIRGIFQSAMTHKARMPQSAPVLFIVDECPQLGRFPLIKKLFAYATGLNIRTWVFVQGLSQLDDMDNNGMEIITASASIQCYYAVQSLSTAEDISAKLGHEEFEIDDKIQQANSRLEARKIGQQIMAGKASTDQLLEMSNHRKAAKHRNKVSKPLMRPEEIMSRLAGKGIVFCSDVGEPIMMTRKAYYDLKEMNGYCHPNPYRPKPDRVKVTGLIRRSRRVIREAVPPEFAHYPQYANGFWSYIDGYKP